MIGLIDDGVLSLMNHKQRLVLMASILGSFVAFLDIAVVNVALPAIRADLGVDWPRNSGSSTPIF